MRASIFIVHRKDGVLRAMVRLLAADGYRVESAESLEALRDALVKAGRPAVLVLDEEDAGAGWRAQLEGVPAEIPRVLLTWYPGASFPPEVTPIAKPFRARELLDTLADKSSLAARAAPARPPEE